MHTRTRLEWARLNADTVLLAGLGFLQGLDLIHPERTAIAQQLGYVPPSSYLWAVLYMVAGGMLILGLLYRRSDIELIGGRLTLCVAAVIENWRIGTAFGWADDVTLERYVVTAIVLSTCALRVTALMPKHTIRIVIPARTRR